MYIYILLTILGGACCTYMGAPDLYAVRLRRKSPTLTWTYAHYYLLARRQ